MAGFASADAYKEAATKAAETVKKAKEDWKTAQVAVDIGLMPDGQAFKGTGLERDGNVLDGCEKRRVRKDQTNPSMVFHQANKSRLVFNASPAPRQFRRVAVKLTGFATPIHEMPYALMRVQIDDQKPITLPFFEGDPATGEAIFDLPPELWKANEKHKVTLMLEHGPSAAFVEHVEVLVQD
jgi:hypothetical protein